MPAKRSATHAAVVSRFSTASEYVEAPFTDALGQEVAPGRYVYVEVTDNGTGMDSATESKIFDPFFTTKFVGRGLGLAAVSGIVCALGDGIALRTAPGQGSSFKVLFPVKQEENVPETGARGTILVVDDETAVRTAVGGNAPESPRERKDRRT